tara:strand:- start:207 stop:356 length:150 start_codon:yes stop_codon:yes gene_type:complete
MPQKKKLLNINNVLKFPYRKVIFWGLIVPHIIFAIVAVTAEIYYLFANK